VVRNATQSATVTAVGAGGKSLYQYNFNNQGFTSNTFVTNTAGPVSVIARDVNGCSFATAVGTTVVALNSYRFNFVVTTAPTCPANTATVQVTATSGLGALDFDVSFNGTPTALYPTVTTAGSATPASFVCLQAITCSK
jgi:hypothetical protein